MNRRSFITKALVGIAAVPLLGKAATPPQTQTHVIVAIGDRELGHALTAYSQTPRGRRARLARP